MRLNWRDLPISTRLRLVTLAASSLALLLACSALFVFELVTFRSAIKRDLSSVARIVAANITAAISFQEQGEAEEILAALGAKPYIISAAVYLPDQGLFAGYSAKEGIGGFPASAGPEGVRNDGRDMILFQPVTRQGERLGTLFIRYDYGGRIGGLARLFAGIAAVVLLVSLGLALLTITRLQRVIAGPILALVNTAKTISERQDYTIRAEKQGQDELAPFIDSFNQMLARIQEQDIALRRAKDELESRVLTRTVELQHLQHQLALILNSAGDGIYGVDLDGRITFANPAAAAFVGRQVSELIGRLAHDLFRPAPLDKDAFSTEQCPVCAALREGRALKLQECRFSRSDGSYFPIELVSTPITETGKVLGTVVVFRDVTDRRNLERQFRLAQKMESVGRMAAGVAHDFSNIIAVIQGYASLLAPSVAAQKEHAQSVKEILQAAYRGGNLTQQLLAFSRTQILQRRPVDLNSVVRNTARMFKRVLGEDIILQVECPPHLPPVLADPGALEQVTMNLVLNARDAMPRGGNLRIETTAALIEASYVQHNPEARIGLFVCLSVTDTGCGMDAETMSRAFEPFFTTKATKGTGLGLATVYGLVKQHEGWVEVESEVGRGSRFRVFIPAIEALPESQETGLPDVSSQVMGEGTILVAEDDESLRRLMCVILRQCGYTVFEAASGTEALHLWSQRTEAVHLLITDLVMPGGVGGLELARTLKSVDPGLKVVYTSGYYVDLPESETEGGRKPIFLRKPFSPDGLARAAKDALGSS